ncbi:MAG: hypothetical protein KA368_19130 [Acidobacteria bacterium]|nr:hypothetical protein [Acidobacteriota bacterium]
MTKSTLSKVLLLFVFAGLLLAEASAQSKKTRDHLTEMEVEQVRDVQQIDLRIEVFIKAADRRILVLTNPAATQKKKEEEVWGPLPTGTKAELLADYKKILEEGEEKLDDFFERDPKNDQLKKALRKFKDAANRQIPQLRAMAAQLTEKADQRALAEAVEEAETVTKADIN